MGELVEIYEPWEKPGGLFEDGITRVIERIEEMTAGRKRGRRAPAPTQKEER